MALRSRSQHSHHAMPHFWTANGQVVFSLATMDAGYGIWTISVDQKNLKPILDTQHNELQAAVSRDDRWMAYTSDQSGRNEIYVQDFRRALSEHGIDQRRYAAAMAGRWT